MYKLGLLALAFLTASACSSTHKLTGTDYVDIESESAPEMPGEYPSEIIDDAGWNDITTTLKKRSKHEELRIWLTADYAPHHLFKFEREGNDVEGENILYWSKDEKPYITPTMQRYLEGTCTSFTETENFWYCHPEFANEINWHAVYTSIERQEMWQIPNGEPIGEEANEVEEQPWQMYVQLRLGNFYRHYMHANAHRYADEELSAQVIAMLRASRQVSMRYESPINTATYEGITNGQKFIPCEVENESWQFTGNLERILQNSGLKTNQIEQEEESLYRILAQGSVKQLWYHTWLSDEHEREIKPIKIFSIRPVSSENCTPDEN